MLEMLSHLKTFFVYPDLSLLVVNNPLENIMSEVRGFGVNQFTDY